MIFPLLWGCCHRNGFDNCQDAALALYSRYADNDRLTVAYLGDFLMQENAIDAVMIQATTNADWDWLQNEFAVPKNCPTMPDDSTSEQNYSLEMGLEWNTSVSTDEAILQKEHLDDDEIDFFAQAIVNQLSATMSSLLASETEVRKALIAIDDYNMMDDLQINLEFRDETAFERIMVAVGEKLKENGLAYNDTSLLAETVIAENEDSLMREAKNHGQNGYVTAVDYINHTLWVFFYTDANECSCIMTHIRKDIFAYPDDVQ